MWKMAQCIALVLLMMICSGGFILACAQDASLPDLESYREGDYTYALISEGAVILSYHGNEANLVIPESLGGYPVTQVCAKSFQEGDIMLTITFPNSVTALGLNAPDSSGQQTPEPTPWSPVIMGNQRCGTSNLRALMKRSLFCKQENLQEVYLSDHIEIIDESVFFGYYGKIFADPDSLTAKTLSEMRESFCIEDYPKLYFRMKEEKGTWKLILDYVDSDIQLAVVPENVSILDNNSFAQCKDLKSVQLPKNLVRIEKGSFVDCENLEMIVLPDSIEYIGEHVFEGCEKLTIIADEGSYAYAWGIKNGISTVKTESDASILHHESKPVF